MNHISPSSFLEAAKVLIKAKRFDEADQIVLSGLEQCADRLALSIEYAWVAHYRADWSEALRRWSALRQEFPNHSSGTIGVARSLLALGRFDEAENWLCNATKEFPQDKHLATEFGSAAIARHDWATAVKRLDEALDLLGDDIAKESVTRQRSIAFWHLQQENLESAVPRAPVSIERVRDPDAYAVLMGFESLGENCEFGLVQRRFEAEPIGLLRWTYTGIDMLGRLLQSNFKRLGDADRLTLSRRPWGEYFLKDLEYGVTFHTFLNDCGSDEGAFLRKQSSRLRWLREKLLVDLSLCEKTFVYKVHYGASEAQIQNILTELRRFGDNRLLCVRLSDSENPGGSTRACEGGLTYGYLSRVEPKSASENWDILFDEWVSICRTVLAPISFIT